MSAQLATKWKACRRCNGSGCTACLGVGGYYIALFTKGPVQFELSLPASRPPKNC